MIAVLTLITLLGLPGLTLALALREWTRVTLDRRAAR